MKQHILIVDTQAKRVFEKKVEDWFNSISNHQLLYLYHCLQKFYYRAMYSSYISFLKNEDNCITPCTQDLASRCNYPFLCFKEEIEKRQLKDLNVNDPFHPYFLWFEEKLSLGFSSNK